MLTEEAALALARELKGYYSSERRLLDVIRRYWKGVQPLPEVIPASAPREVRTMARIARVNVCPIVVDSLAQSCYVDNFRTSNSGEDAAVWRIWQKNKMDARQTGVHRAAFAYGASYAVVLPGDPVPVIRGVSPRLMTTLYGDDPDWPVAALENRGNRAWRLYDETSVYLLRANGRGSEFDLVGTMSHDAGTTPVVRYLDEDDLDADDDVTTRNLVAAGMFERPLRGQIGPLMTIQDQIDLTSFGLLVAQWYAAFRQRWAIGWVPESEAQVMKASASQLWSFDESPDELKLGEFEASSLDGYIKSREASLRHAATLSQTPVHELIGELANLSAEALAAAEQGHERKVAERRTLLGESHEQTLRLAARFARMDVPDDAEVTWRDTSARTFAATVDGLGKLATMLGVPLEELWARVPGVTHQDVERWKAAAATGDAFAQLSALLERESAAGATINLREA